MSESPYLDRLTDSPGTSGEYRVLYGDSLSQYDGPTICDSAQAGGGSLLATKMVSAGAINHQHDFGHAVALRNDGTVWVWGFDIVNSVWSGFSISTVVRNDAPVQITALTGIMHVSAGMENILAVKSDGTLWGLGVFRMGFPGQSGEFVKLSVPTQAEGIYDAVQCASGENVWGAVLADGTVRMWGNNAYGQLGDGSTDASSLTAVQPDITGVKKLVISAGEAGCVMAIRGISELWGWGANGYAQMARPASAEPQRTPVGIPWVGPVQDVDATDDHVLALASDGRVLCWGKNTWGAFGPGFTWGSLYVEPQVLQVGRALRVLALNSTNVVMKDNGELVSAGYTLTIGRSPDDPGANPNRNESFRRIDATNIDSLFGNHTFSGGGYIDGNCEVWSWGNNVPIAINDLPHPTKISGVVPIGTFSATLVSAGGKSNTSQVSDGSVWGWGDNNFGEIGDGTMKARPAAVRATRISG